MLAFLDSMNDDDGMAPVVRCVRGFSWLAVAITTVALAACVTSPPVQEMSDARQAIAAAAEAEAATLASETFDEAQRYLAEAERLLREEAYGAARANAIRARDRAMRALSATQNAEESRDNR